VREDSYTCLSKLASADFMTLKTLGSLFAGSSRFFFELDKAQGYKQGRARIVRAL